MMKKCDEIYADKYCHKSTITHLFGVNKNIEKVEEEAPPLLDTNTQTDLPKNYANTQTDEGMHSTAEYFFGQPKNRLASPATVIKRQNSIATKKGKRGANDQYDKTKTGKKKSLDSSSSQKRGTGGG